MSDRTAIRASNVPADAGAEPISREALGLPTRYLPPESEIERKVSAFWREACNIDRVGLNDDFFDLGGDSLTATLISIAITSEFNYKFQPSILMTRSTVAAVASLLEREVGGAEQIGARDPTGAEVDPPHLVAIRAEGELPPLFIVHGRLGISFMGADFVSEMDPRQPMYFIQALGYFDDEKSPRRIPEIARIYLATMRRKQPDGPLNIGAFCSGGMIAAEIAAILAEQGDPPASVILVDPPVPRAVRKGRAPGYLAVLCYRFKRWWKLVRLNARIRLAGNRPAVPVSHADDGMQALYLQQVAALGEVNSGIDSPMPGMARQAYEALLEAFYTYDPRPYAGPVDIISSRERLGGVKAEDHAWHGFMSNLRLHVAGDKHSDLFDGEAGRTARKVQECVLARQDSGQQ